MEIDFTGRVRRWREDKPGGVAVGRAALTAAHADVGDEVELSIAPSGG